MAVKTLFIISNEQSVYRSVNNKGSAVILIGVAADYADAATEAFKLMNVSPVYNVTLEPTKILFNLEHATHPIVPNSVTPDLIKQIGDLIGWRPLTEDERRGYRTPSPLNGDDPDYDYWESSTVLIPTETSTLKFLSDTAIVHETFQLRPLTMGELYAY
jgi:hypothetical protein